MNVVYIGNLDYAAVEADIRTLCEQFGDVNYVSIPKNREGSGSKGFAFVRFDSELSADRCILMLDGQPFQGRVLRVEAAHPRTTCLIAKIYFYLFFQNPLDHLGAII